MDNENNTSREGMNENSSGSINNEQAVRQQPEGASRNQTNAQQTAAQNNFVPYQPQPYYYTPYQAPVKKKNAGMKVLVALLVIMSLVVGGLLTAYVVMPAVENHTANIQSDETASAVDTESQDNTALPTLEDEDSTSTDAVEQSAASSNTSDSEESEDPIVQIAKDLSPSVVGVTVSVDYGTDEETISEESGYGTGIIITEDGYIVTNNHVIADIDSVVVTLNDGTEYDAVIVGADATTDLAVLKIDATGLTAAALGDSDALQVGETVVAIGNPLGLDLSGTVTSGIISGLNRELNAEGYTQDYIQTDAAINPGNSGGPLINMDGEVIGINTLKSYIAGYDDYGQSISTEGIGFAIPISSALPIIEQIMDTGSVERPGIGISCFVDSTYVYNAEGSPEGVTVAAIVENGPADTANLMVADIITAIDGVEVTTVDELVSMIQEHSIGDEIELTVWRDGQEYITTVTIGDLNNMG